MTIQPIGLNCVSIINFWLGFVRLTMTDLYTEATEKHGPGYTFFTHTECSIPDESIFSVSVLYPYWYA